MERASSNIKDVTAEETVWVEKMKLDVVSISNNDFNQNISS